MIQNTKIILGVDPGYARLGFGVIEAQGQKLKTLDFGCLETKKDAPAEKRLLFLSRELEKIIKKYQPEKIVVEKVFFFKNNKTALGVGEARGIILLVAAQAGLPLIEVTPLQVKSALTGYGLADKKQIQAMIKNIFKLKEVPKPDDAADALAIAYCGASWCKFS